MTHAVIVVLAALAMALPASRSSFAAPPSSDSGLTAQVLEPDAAGSSPTLREIPARPPGHPPALRKVPRQPIPRRALGLPTVPDPVLQSAPGTFAMPSTAANFEGI